MVKNMDQELISSLIKAGDINKKTQEYAKKFIKPGIELNDIALKIDKFIREHSGNPAWPVNLSLNNEAAHNAYNPEKNHILTDDDVLKVDVGVEVNGYIADSSQTIYFSKKHEKLSEASKQALFSAKKYLEEHYNDAKICDVGEIIENKIKECGFKPISNLTGHCLGRYSQHEAPSIPNVKNSISIKFKDLDTNFAIEPFASTGSGYVREGPDVLIFRFEQDKAVRNKDAKNLLEEIKKFNGLPFSEYWIGKDLSPFVKKFALRELLKSEIISAYPVLYDDKGSYVSQWETTFIITKDGLQDIVNILDI
jgi:methionyl aminopeptidase